MQAFVHATDKVWLVKVPRVLGCVRTQCFLPRVPRQCPAEDFPVLGFSWHDGSGNQCSPYSKHKSPCFTEISPNVATVCTASKFVRRCRVYRNVDPSVNVRHFFSFNESLEQKSSLHSNRKRAVSDHNLRFYLLSNAQYGFGDSNLRLQIWM